MGTRNLGYSGYKRGVEVRANLDFLCLPRTKKMVVFDSRLSRSTAQLHASYSPHKQARMSRFMTITLLAQKRSGKFRLSGVHAVPRFYVNKKPDRSPWSRLCRPYYASKHALFLLKSCPNTVHSSVPSRADWKSSWLELETVAMRAASLGNRLAIMENGLESLQNSSFEPPESAGRSRETSHMALAAAFLSLSQRQGVATTLAPCFAAQRMCNVRRLCRNVSCISSKIWLGSIIEQWFWTVFIKLWCA